MVSTITLERLHQGLLDCIVGSIDIYCDVTALTYKKCPQHRLSIVNNWLVENSFFNGTPDADLAQMVHRTAKIEADLRLVLAQRRSDRNISRSQLAVSSSK